MNLLQMRKEVSDAYKNKTWKEKVRKMSDNQVIAIFYRLMNAKKPEVIYGSGKGDISILSEGIQLSLFDMMEE